jgi:nucleotide-binding universal stress UspA family protein
MKADPILNAPSALLHLREILVPTDFSSASKKSFRYALRFAEQFGAAITLLHVIAPPAPAMRMALVPEADFEDRLAIAEKNLHGLTDLYHAADSLTVQANVRIGQPSHDIVEAARELDSDLIVIATHGYTGWKHLCLGSTAERVVRCAPCPVLVVREKEHEFI